MRNIFIAVGAAGAVLITSATAAAQIPTSRPERPYRGLFGPDTSTAAEVLSVSGSVGTGWESDVVVDLPEENGGLPSGPTREAAFGMLSGGLSYARHQDRFDLGASVFSSGRYYPAVSGHVMTSHAAAVGASLKLTESTLFTASESVTYQPWQVFTYFPMLFTVPLGQTIAPNQDFAAGGSEYFSSGTSASITQRLSRRAVLEAGYTYQRGNISTYTGSFDGDFETQYAWARFSRSISRNLGLRLGYNYAEFQFSPDGNRYRGDTIDAGVDYSRDLSITRRTRVSFSTGASGIREGTYTRYGATGTAGISREIGRSWLAAAGYSRNIVFVEWLRAPYFYDGINVSLNGLISRRVSVHSGAGWTFGTLGLERDTNRTDQLNTGYAAAGVTYAISRHFAASADYVYYVYSYDPLSPYSQYGLISDLSRHGVRVALNAWAPLFERGRRPNATR
jgi:hypothetical protein